MSAAEALKGARVAGIQLGIDGDDLVLEASAPPPPAVIDLLSRHKAEVVALLRPSENGWSAEDWQAFFDERAGIAEFDGGVPCAEAEARAFVCCIVEWLNRNPVRSLSSRCLGCGQVEHAHDPLLPFGTETTGHIPGCTRAAGRPGTARGRPTPSPHWQQWECTNLGRIDDRKEARQGD